VSDIGFKLRSHRVEILWGLFAAANVVAMVILGEGETIPFHFVWVSLTLVYGFRMWRPQTTAITVIVVCLATGVALYWAVTSVNGPGLDEMAEIPLMGAMFVGMVWHVERTRAATDQARRLAEGQRRLLESQREFVRDASHELHTPITVAQGHAELIRSAAGDRQIAEDAEVVLDELGRLSRMSERLLILAAVDHPEFLVTAPTPAGPLVEATARRWSATPGRRWQRDITADGWIQADEERLRMALDALIENAVKYTHEGDTVAIRARGNEDELLIEIADTGVGIPAEDIPRVFERFKRANGNGARPRGGAGLGLAIVKAVVEGHGGSVSVKSVVGRGSLFRVVLPGYRPFPATAADTADPPNFLSSPETTNTGIAH
jgi:signal transduction histidine kinase